MGWVPPKAPMEGSGRRKKTPLFRRLFQWIAGTCEVPPAPATAERKIEVWRGRIRECPKCGAEHDDVIAMPLKPDSDGPRFLLICPQTGNEIIVGMGADE